jgi:hypothetical protein
MMEEKRMFWKKKDAKSEHFVEVENTLKEQGMSQYVNILKAQGIDDKETFLKITEDDLKEMEIAVGDRKKILEAIEEIKEPWKKYM